MPGTIRIALSGRLQNSALEDIIRSKSYSIDQNTLGQDVGTQIFGTSEEDLEISADIGTEGLCFLELVWVSTAGAYFECGPKDAGVMVPLAWCVMDEPGLILRLKPGVTIRGKMSAGTGKINKRVYED